MRYIHIKAAESEMKVSGIALGTANFGTSVSEEEAFRLMDRFADLGGNCLDSARVYADWIPGGRGASERTLGRWIKARGNRNSILISTKGAHPPLGDMSRSRMSRRDIEEDLDESLRTLGVDEIDLYWLHRDDETVPAEEIMESLSLMVKKGKIRAAGCSNWKTARIEEANRKARQAGFTPFGASQIMWSFASIRSEATGDPTMVCMSEGEYQWYEKEQFPVFAYSSQANGFFTRGAAGGPEALYASYGRYISPENLSRLERVKEYSARTGLTPTAAALGYILCNAVPAVAIVGCKNEEQLADTMAAADVKLPAADVKWLENGKNTDGEGQTY